MIAAAVIRTIKAASFKNNIAILTNQAPDFRATIRALVQSLINPVELLKNATIAAEIFICRHSGTSSLPKIFYYWVIAIELRSSETAPLTFIPMSQA
jgi:hypothetical protein